MFEVPTEERNATLSTCGLFRYTLGRDWTKLDGLPDGSRWMVVVGLNPSTADAEKDDPTMRRVRGFAKARGAAGFTMLNLFGFRATKPRDLWARARAGLDVVGPDNDTWTRATFEARPAGGLDVVAAWGAGPSSKADIATFNTRVDAVCRIARDVGVVWRSWGMTEDGHPRHPLYVPAITTLGEWGDWLALRCSGCGRGSVSDRRAGVAHDGCLRSGSFEWVGVRS